MLNFFSKVKKALSKTGSFFSSKVRELLKGKIDEETLDKLERLFYEADLGVALSSELVDIVRKTLQKNPQIEREKLIELLRSEITERLKRDETALLQTENSPLVILVVGINGSGKTTSVAKLGYYYQTLGKKVLVAAADTFRAAAISQLEIWAERLNIDIVKSLPGSDPSSVVFDALTAAKARNIDVVIVDTAGRLHVKVDLMHELQKMRKVCTKVCPNTPQETLLVLDASIGQNAIEQAKTFHKFTPLTGIILTKIDGTTKGGVALAIQKECGIPIKLLGVGESLEDLQPFDAESFATALLP